MWKKVYFHDEEIARAFINMKRKDGMNPIMGKTPWLWYVAWHEPEVEEVKK